MGKTRSRPRVIFPEGFDERAAFETPLKGWLSAQVELEDGRRYAVYFSDPIRLHQDLDEAVRSGKPCVAEPGLIIIPEVTIETIQRFVSDYYQLKIADLKSRNNSKSVAMPRQVAMYLCKSLTHASLPEIGRSFGGKHHSTVIHSLKKVEELRKRDADFNSLIGNFLESFR